MSLQSFERNNAILKERDIITKGAANAVSQLVKQTAAVRLFIVFLHDNLLNNRGDMSEGDRLDIRDALVPLYPQIQSALSEITELFNIHNDDPTVWKENLNTYLAVNPTVLQEAVSRFPKVV